MLFAVRKFMVHKMKPFLDHAYTRLAIGGILISSAILDMADLAIEHALGIHVEVEHGMIIFGVFTVARALHDVAEGMELVGLEKKAEELKEMQSALSSVTESEVALATD
jgi:hypothetical protein